MNSYKIVISFIAHALIMIIPSVRSQNNAIIGPVRLVGWTTGAPYMTSSSASSSAASSGSGILVKGAPIVVGEEIPRPSSPTSISTPKMGQPETPDSSKGNTNNGAPAGSDKSPANNQSVDKSPGDAPKQSPPDASKSGDTKANATIIGVPDNKQGNNTAPSGPPKNNTDINPMKNVNVTTTLPVNNANATAGAKNATIPAFNSTMQAKNSTQQAKNQTSVNK